MIGRFSLEGGFSTPTQYIAGLHTNPASNRYDFSLAQYTGGFDLGFFALTDNSNRGVIELSDGDFPEAGTSAYINVALRFDGTKSGITNVLSCFRNGVLLTPKGQAEIGTMTTIRAGGTMSLGRDEGSAGRDFIERLDGWKFWNRALSDAEIGAIYADEYNELLEPALPLQYFTPAGSSITASVTGTATASITEADIVTGGKEVIITLTGDTWIAAGTGAIGTQEQSLAICQSLDSAQAEAAGWDAEVKANFVHTDIVRTSATVATITLGAESSYDITAQETITMGDIANAVLTNSGVDVTPSSNTFTVDLVSAASLNAGSLMMMGVGI